MLRLMALRLRVGVIWIIFFSYPLNLQGETYCFSKNIVLSHPIADTNFNYNRGYRGGILSHNGIDISVAEGTKIRALRSGVIVTVKWDRNLASRREDGGVGYGFYLIIGYDDGHHGYYAHLKPNSAFFSPGVRVETGQVIALSGNSGRSTGPHLHYGETGKDGQKNNKKNSRARMKKNWIDPGPLIATSHLRDYPDIPLTDDLRRALDKKNKVCKK